MHAQTNVQLCAELHADWTPKHGPSTDNLLILHTMATCNHTSQIQEHLAYAEDVHGIKAPPCAILSTKPDAMIASAPSNANKYSRGTVSFLQNTKVLGGSIVYGGSCTALLGFMTLACHPSHKSLSSNSYVLSSCKGTSVRCLKT